MKKVMLIALSLTVFLFLLMKSCISLLTVAFDEEDPNLYVWDTADTAWYTNNTSATEFTITTAEQLAGLAKLVTHDRNFEGKTITLGANIMLNDTVKGRLTTRRWMPIGSRNRGFHGTFDGNGFAVSGVYISSNLEYAGLFGLVGENNGNIINSYSMAYMPEAMSGAGLVGVNKGKIINCYSTGAVVPTIERELLSFFGGLVADNVNGYYGKGEIYNSYYDKETSGQSTGIGYDQDETKTEVYGKTTAEMKQKATFKDWDFTETWGISDTINFGYPYIRKIRK
ncbi:MAG: hypothetical protein LBH25_01715 [Fibromonadaceae bacterium]|jgi:hypothetical protein|nr:hypothetical protein [Fibromonadaceae bacterium]